MNNKILIAIIIGVCMVAAAGIIAFGMMNANHNTIIINSTNGTNNNTNHTNITNNATVEHTNNNDVQHEQSETTSNNHDDGFNHYIDENGFNHYIDENGNAMVGNPNSQHMSESQHQYVLAHGMA